MFGSIIRNYKNAGVRVNVALCLQLDAQKKEFPPLFVHGATGLEIHNLASKAHRELLGMAMKSSLPRRPGERFEDIAWKLAAHSLVQALPELRLRPASEVKIAIPYTCFIAEYLSKTFRDGEERDVCVAADGKVFINTFAGLHSESKILGIYRE